MQKLLKRFRFVQYVFTFFSCFGASCKAGILKYNEENNEQHNGKIQITLYELFVRDSPVNNYGRQHPPLHIYN